MFIKDRDLLLHEPSLFRDVGWVGQRLVKGSAGIVGTLLTFVSADVPLDQAGIDVGHVVAIGGASYEVVDRVSSTELTISRARSRETDEIQPPAPSATDVCTISTFAPQIGLVHDQILRTLGIEPGEASAIGKVTESSITNAAAFKEVAALGALHLIYSAAAALGGSGSAADQRAALYRERFGAARWRAVALIDTNGDGVADASRRMNVAQFVR